MAEALVITSGSHKISQLSVLFFFFFFAKYWSKDATIIFDLISEVNNVQSSDMTKFLMT